MAAPVWRRLRVWRRLEDIPAGFGPSALTIGNFDGVHAGHRVLLRTASRIGRGRGWNPSVLTFDPHPAKVVAPARAPQLITSFERRVELMADEGIQQVLILPFTREVSLWPPEYFVERLLVNGLGAKAVVVGDDFRFGHNQSGDRHLLEALGARHGFEVAPVAPVEVRGGRVSSSLVREMVRAGRVARAARLLARPFELQGRVVKGEGVGSRQTVPTLNLEPDSEVLPLSGVYVTRTLDLDAVDPGAARRWESITNVGTRPTFGGSAITVETFLLDALDPPPPERIRVQFLWRIRDERKFASADALRTQIVRDAERARRVHARLRNIPA